jgi:hypothetical protein
MVGRRDIILGLSHGTNLTFTDKVQMYVLAQHQQKTYLTKFRLLYQFLSQGR